jgi:hypothetical protein
MPITRPKRSSSGPPEFPWLIGASVWTAFAMVKPFGAWMSRPGRAHDPGGHRAIEPERVADRVRGIADGDVVRVVERERVQRVRRRLDADDGHVGRRVGADHLRRVGRAAGEPDADPLCVLDDVDIGEDVASPVDDEAGAEHADLLLCRRREERRRDDLGASRR